MDRFLLLFATSLGAILPWLIDSTLKSVPVLIAAGAAAVASRHASAATRHFFWLIALTASLALPVLSIVLPTWRVLPSWNGLIAPQATALETHFAVPPSSGLVKSEIASTLSTTVPLALQIDKNVRAAPSIGAWPALSLVWATGCAILLLRLCAARFILRRTFRRCSLATDDLIVQELQCARAQLGVQRPIVVLRDRAQTIPFVSGLLRPRLVLPDESNQWSRIKMRSVLLHELAHVKRNDIAIQWLTQIVCAVHWFNPLVWLAAWRLRVERERACDDLVLASGVHASDYAEHLLHVATTLGPAVGASSCALTMARPSRLEGRLLDVLNGRLNRSGITRALALGTIGMAIVMIVPIAMLRAADEKSASDSLPAESAGSNSQPTTDPQIASQETKASHDPGPDAGETAKRFPLKSRDQEILKLRKQLDELLQVFTETHPKIKETRARIAQLEAGRHAQDDEAVQKGEPRKESESGEEALARIRLKQAELEMQRAADLYQQKMISASEYEKAKAMVDVRRAELRGDQTEVARVELAQAEAQLARLSEVHREKLVSDAEYEQAKFAVEEARIRLKQRELGATDAKRGEAPRVKAVSKIPVLGDIPILGRLFQTTDVTAAAHEPSDPADAHVAEPDATVQSGNGSPRKSEIRVLGLKYGDVSTVAPLVEQAITAQKKTIHALPDARTNSLVVVGDRDAIDAASRFVAGLDRPPPNANFANDFDAKRDDKNPEVIKEALAAQKALVEAARAHLQEAETQLKRLQELQETHSAPAR